VGSSANCAASMTVLNTIMCETLTQFKTDVDALIEKGEKKEIALMQTIQKYIVDSKKILFEGDGYSPAWEKEAEKRGLPNVKTTPLALDSFVTDESKKVFARYGIYTNKELEARHEILLENYTKKIQIEARIMGDLASTYILPAAIKYQNLLIKNIKGLKEIGFDENSYASQKHIVKKISEHINIIRNRVEAMIEARKVANEVEDSREKAIMYCDDVKKYFDEIRYHVDKLELLVDDEYWELPKYRELLFLR
jgi:glutamine synthetase